MITLRGFYGGNYFPYFIQTQLTYLLIVSINEKKLIKDHYNQKKENKI